MASKMMLSRIQQQNTVGPTRSSILPAYHLEKKKNQLNADPASNYPANPNKNTVWTGVRFKQLKSTGLQDLNVLKVSAFSSSSENKVHGMCF